jgi:hypothetical protein
MIDPRGPRFAAWITTLVLAAVLVTGSAWLLVVQAAVFTLGATGHNPYSLFWKRYLKRTPPAELEDARPPKFAQLVGLGFAVVGLVGFATGADGSGAGPVEPPSSLVLGCTSGSTRGRSARAIRIGCGAAGCS